MAVAKLRLEGLAKVYPGNVQAVKSLDLEIEQGEFFAILGPSGCGKTTTLRMIAGLEDPTSGRIHIDGADITTVPTHKRSIGVVFQSYALFPHMTVKQNIAFGLKMRGWSREKIDRKVKDLLEIIHLPDVGNRLIGQLSGGQQQRVALARALAPEPAILLLDEPLSNLDLKLRQEMRLEIRRIQRELGITTVFVTHDQGEALALSDRVMVMNGGVVSQMGTPSEVYERPRTSWVASFIGDANILEGIVEPDGLFRPDGASRSIRIPGLPTSGSRATVAMRPEAIESTDSPIPSDEAEGSWALGLIENLAYVGSATRYVLRVNEIGNSQVLVDVPASGTPKAVGSELTMRFPKHRWIVLES